MPMTSKGWTWIISALVGAGYGLIVRAVVTLHVMNTAWFEIMSCAFIFGVPVALGFVSIWLGTDEKRFGWLSCIFAPWIAAGLFLVGALALAWEGIICIIIWLPLVLILSTFGGLLAGICHRMLKAKRNRNLCVAIFALLPLVAGPVERFVTVPPEIRDVQTEIKIHASPSTVWNEIKTVRMIEDREQSFSFTHLMGLPRPREAKLVGEGVGAVRYASFDKGVLFVETITEWDEGHRLEFTIRADTEHIPPNTFDEHVIVGGRYFDVLTGTYWIEPVSGGDVILHLSSSQRLSTHFNFYSHHWTEWMMADLQNYILAIIKRRCEVV